MPGGIFQDINFNIFSVPPGAYVDVTPPPPFGLGPNPDVIGMPFTSDWGPVGAAQICGSLQQFISTFGDLTASALNGGTAGGADQWDGPTAAYIAFQQAGSGGALTLIGVRVTDGTDAAASLALKDGSSVTGATFLGINTGTYGNQIKITLQAGQVSGTYDVIIQGWSGTQAEVFRGIGGSGAAFWANLVSAINQGQTTVRPKSGFVTAIVGTSTAAPAAISNVPLTGGLSGRSGVTASMILGSDAAPRTGMYGLRNQGCSVVFFPNGMPDTTKWPNVQSFADTENVLVVLNIAQGTLTGSAISTVAGAGIQDYNVAIINEFGRWWDDNNETERIVPLAPFYAGLLGTLSPQFSPIGKSVVGLIATDRTSAQLPYTDGELVELANAGIEIITNPSTAGNTFAPVIGRNTILTNLAQSPIEYSRMVNWLGRAIYKQMQQFVGAPQTEKPNDPTRHNVEAMGNQFLQLLASPSLNMIDAGIMECSGPEAGSSALNTPGTIAAHFLFASAKITLISSVWWFVTRLIGGTTVVAVGPSVGAALQALPPAA